MYRSICFLLFIMGSLVSSAQKRSFNQPLADSLAKWVVIDQIAANTKKGEFKLLSDAQWTHYKDSVFTAHQLLLEKIFDQYGYPGYDLVGQKGTNNFWLMVQHCDKDPAFQQKILTAMKKEVDAGNADGKNYAYLIDRVNVNTKKKQIYGTQLTYKTDSCQAIPRPLIDSLNVNQRRKQVGLGSIEEYLNMMSQMHFDMNKEVYEKKGIHKPKLIPETTN